MEFYLNTEKLTAHNAVVSREGNTIKLRADGAEPYIEFDGISAIPQLEAARYLTCTLTTRSLKSQLLTLRFYKAGSAKPDINYNIRLIPSATATFCMALTDLNCETAFPLLTPGTLKSNIGGRAMKIAETERIQLGFDADTAYELTGLRFCSDEPEYIQPQSPIADELGQWTAKDWQGKTHGADELKTRLESEYQKYTDADFGAEYDSYGGLRGMKLTEGSGWFAVAADANGRKWFVDPNGCVFYSVGVFGVYPGEGGWIRGNEGYYKLPEVGGKFAEAYVYAEDDELFRRKFSGKFPPDTRLYQFATANLIRAFGSDWRSKWTNMTAGRLKTWGVNTLSMFSDPQFIADSGMAFVIMMKKFPSTKNRVFREFPDVFSDEYRVNCAAFAEQLRAYQGNNRLIGYFLNNEPTWAWSDMSTLAEKLLEKDTPFVSRGHLIQYLREKYNDEILAFNRAWGLELDSFDGLDKPIRDAALLSQASRRDLEEFSLVMVDEYSRVPSEAARKILPHHLNLGMRFAGTNTLSVAASKYFDVYSFNYYGTDPSPRLDWISAETAPLTSDKSGKPILIGEFHFGALDRGLPAASLVECTDQNNRAEKYRAYINSAAEHKNSVGAHYFAYNDQPLLGRYDGENYQFGFVDICNLPYEEFTAELARTNNRIRNT